MQQTHPNGIVPSAENYRIGVRHGLTAQALQYVWDRLSRTEYRDAMALADEAALVYKILPTSVRSYVYRVAAKGHLETENGQTTVRVTRAGKTFEAKRKRVLYRIAQTPVGR